MTTDKNFEEAAEWLVRQQSGAIDWDRFADWLEADPGHRLAFDELALIDAALDDHAHTLADAVPLAPANDRAPLRWGRWAGLGGISIAAGLALVLALQPVGRDLPVENFRSAAGHSREIALNDGTNVVLAPASLLTVKGDQLTLQGTGYFNVPHRPGRTLTVTAGAFTVTDIGTRFSVGNETDGVSVEVAEGSLSVRSARLTKPIALAAGHGIRSDRLAGTVRQTTVAPGDVASWRSGRLQFDRTPLALVARDIARYSGETVTVDPAVAGQPFSGVIAIDDGTSPGRTLAQILALDARPVAGGVRLEPRRR